MKTSEICFSFEKGSSNFIEAAPPPSPSCCSYVCTHPLFRDFRRKGHPLIGLMDSPKVTTVWIASSSSSTSSFVSLSLSMKWIFLTIDWERIAVNLSNWENLISRCCIELKFVRVRRKKIKMRRTEGGAEREREAIKKSVNEPSILEKSQLSKENVQRIPAWIIWSFRRVESYISFIQILVKRREITLL